MPHYGAFDTSIDSIFDISIDTSIDISIFDILCLPHCGEFDIRVCQIPTIAPYNPEGGVVGEYIDRCITNITSLAYLDLSHNSRMSYSVPKELWEMKNIENIDLLNCLNV